MGIEQQMAVDCGLLALRLLHSPFLQKSSIGLTFVLDYTSVVSYY